MTVASAVQSEGTRVVDLAPYLRHGFVVHRDVVPHDVLDAMSSAIERQVHELARQALARGEIASLHEDLDFEHRLLPIFAGRPLDQRSFDPLRSTSEVGEIVTHPALVELLVPILGPEITYQGNSHVRANRPGRPKVVPWHQDAQFYGRGTEHARDHMAQVWLPLMDVDLDNGCLMMVPGSHRWGLLGGDADTDAKAAQKAGAQSHRGNQERLRVAGERAQAAQVVDIPMRKGDVVIFTNLTVHTGWENRSSRVRWSVDVRYESTLGSRPLTKAARDGFAAYHRRVPGGGRLPLRVHGAHSPESWDDWQRRCEQVPS